jgi:hypothetical protein
VVRKITNGQLTLKESGKRLITTVLSLLKDLSTHEHLSMRSYDRHAQLDFTTFRHLIYTISNFALKKIEAEWISMKALIEEVLGISYLSISCLLTNKIDAQLISITRVSSCADGVFPVGITFGAPI